MLPQVFLYSNESASPHLTHLILKLINPSQWALIFYSIDWFPITLVWRSEIFNKESMRQLEWYGIIGKKTRWAKLRWYRKNERLIFFLYLLGLAHRVFFPMIPYHTSSHLDSLFIPIMIPEVAFLGFFFIRMIPYHLSWPADRYDIHHFQRLGNDELNCNSYSVDVIYHGICRSLIHISTLWNKIR